MWEAPRDFAVHRFAAEQDSAAAGFVAAAAEAARAAAEYSVAACMDFHTDFADTGAADTVAGRAADRDFAAASSDSAAA